MVLIRAQIVVRVMHLRCLAQPLAHSILFGCVLSTSDKRLSVTSPLRSCPTAGADGLEQLTVHHLALDNINGDCMVADRGWGGSLPGRHYFEVVSYLTRRTRTQW